MKPAIQREFKNSVFLDLFSRDEYRLQMFQALHPEETDVTAADIQPVTLQQVITNHQYNDLALLVRDRLLIFVEAQSIWSVNILIRMLLYYADTIHDYIRSHGLNVYGTSRIAMPTPEFYVIYTGGQATPEYVSLRDDFFASCGVPIDMTVKVLTLETEDIIGQYIIFCHVMDSQIRSMGRTQEAAAQAIRICRDRNVLAAYLKEQETEVLDIMMTLFNQETVVEMLCAEQRQEGTISTLFKLVQQGLLTKAQAAAQVDMTEAEFDARCSMLN